jgi:hypothetical protein
MEPSTKKTIEQFGMWVRGLLMVKEREARLNGNDKAPTAALLVVVDDCTCLNVVQVRGLVICAVSILWSGNDFL